MTDEQINAWLNEAFGGNGACSGPIAPETRRFAELVAAHERERMRALILDDAWSLTFQTFGQYRTALAKAIQERGQ